LFLTHCLSHLLFLVRLVAVWFAYKSAVMMLLIVPVKVQGSRCMGPGSVSWDYDPCQCKTSRCTTSSRVAVVSDMPIYVGFLDVCMFCMLHALYIYIQVYTSYKSLPKCPFFHVINIIDFDDKIYINDLISSSRSTSSITSSLFLQKLFLFAESG
jgi:hypothetical protein